MDGFYLLCGHLLGDYILQNDWMARNKTNASPGPEPKLADCTPEKLRPQEYPGPYSVDVDPSDRLNFAKALERRNNKIRAWDEAQARKLNPDKRTAEEVYQERLQEWEQKDKAADIGEIACFVHCVIYTLSVYLCSFWWMTFPGLVACFFAHFFVDRFRLARAWMLCMGQREFATGPLAPWSIVAVDNTFHLLTLAAIRQLI